MYLLPISVCILSSAETVNIQKQILSAVVQNYYAYSLQRHLITDQSTSRSGLAFDTCVCFASHKGSATSFAQRPFAQIAQTLMGGGRKPTTHNTLHLTCLESEKSHECQ